MTIEEKVREIMLSEELSDSEKLDRLHALIPPEAFKIDSRRKEHSTLAKSGEHWAGLHRSCVGLMPLKICVGVRA
jgi:hypothetical protein